MRLFTQRAFRLRFLIWLCAIIIVLVFFIRMLVSGPVFDTNIMALLPHASTNQVSEKAGGLLSARLEKKIIILIGAHSQSHSIKAADIFYHEIAGNQLFKQISYKTSAQQQAAWARFYFPYRLSLFSNDQQRLLRTHHQDQIVQSALTALYNPTSLVSSQLLATDPYFTFFNFIAGLPNPEQNVRLLNNRLMVHFQNRWYVLITATLLNDSFSMHVQDKVTKIIRDAKIKTLTSNPEVTILNTGFLFFAKAGADMARHDVARIAIGSIIGVILLMLLTFRSLSPIFFTLLSGLLGFMSAFVVTAFVFWKIIFIYIGFWG